MTTTKKHYRYTAYNNNTSGHTFEFDGTLIGAIRKAKRYAKEAFPAWNYKGYGPTIKIVDEIDEIVCEERL